MAGPINKDETIELVIGGDKYFVRKFLSYWEVSQIQIGSSEFLPKVVNPDIEEDTPDYNRLSVKCLVETQLLKIQAYLSGWTYENDNSELVNVPITEENIKLIHKDHWSQIMDAIREVEQQNQPFRGEQGVDGDNGKPDQGHGDKGDL
jgi:hypothetical protein